MPTSIVDAGLGADANLQGHWKFESNLNDSSSNAYNLTGSGSPTYASGLFGNAIDLEISSSQYASIVDASCANLEIAGSQSWSAWVNVESNNNSGDGYEAGVMSKCPAGFANHHSLWLANLYPRFTLLGLTTNTVVTADNPITLGTWNHICGVYNSATTSLSLFVNAVKKSVTASGSAGDSNAPFLIGAMEAGTTRRFDGLIEDAAIFNRALTDAEVNTIFSAGPRVMWFN